VPPVKPKKQCVRLSVRSTSGQFEDEFNLNNRVVIQVGRDACEAVTRPQRQADRS